MRLAPLAFVLAAAALAACNSGSGSCCRPCPAYASRCAPHVPQAAPPPILSLEGLEPEDVELFHARGLAAAAAAPADDKNDTAAEFLASAAFRDPATIPAADATHMVAHFIYIGQGAATLLELSKGAIVVDCGAQYGTIDKSSPATTSLLVRYLDAFFASRPGLNRTIDTVFITHDHKDHEDALPYVLARYTVKHYVDNGPSAPGPNGGQMSAVYRSARAAAAQKGITVRAVRSEDVPAPTAQSFGLRGADIDAINFADCDPAVAVLSGRNPVPAANPGDWAKENNHSLAIRVDWGQSSFLITGDLEVNGSRALVSRYGNVPGGPLDVEVYEAGHHGSENGTTAGLMAAVTPWVAVISAGNAFYQGQRSGWEYGHPHKGAVQLLEASA